MTEVRSDAPAAGSPPLMIVHPDRLPPDAIERLRESLDLARSRKPPVTVLEDGLSVYQLVGGVWYPLDAPPPPPQGRRYLIAPSGHFGVLMFHGQRFEVLCGPPNA